MPRPTLLRPAPTHLYHRGPTDGPVRLEWLGTAGFTVTSPERVVVLDPFVTRPPLHRMPGRLRPDEALIERAIPRADDVVIGHAHYDHLLDAPELCRRTGARFIGSPSACNVARAGGVSEERIIATRGNEDIACGGSVVVHGYPSEHGRIYGIVPLPGTIDVPPSWPPRNRELRCGLVFNWLLTVDGPDRPLRILHVDSAQFFAEQLRGVQADVLCLCAIGRNYRPRYLEEIVELTSPRYIVPCHWDWFFDPYDAPPRQLPGVDLEGFVDQIDRAGVEPVVLPIGGVFAPPARS